METRRMETRRVEIVTGHPLFVPISDDRIRCLPPRFTPTYLKYPLLARRWYLASHPRGDQLLEVLNVF